MMNPAAILALISDLYAQVSQLQADNERLTAERDDLLQRLPGAAESTSGGTVADPDRADEHRDARVSHV